MGCTDSRNEAQDEESIIKKEEENLGYSKLHCDKIDLIFKRYSLSSKMHGSQFLTACRELALDMSSYGNPDRPLTKFYHSFKMNYKHFNQRRLSTLGVLLGQGSHKEKAKVLFKIYDIVKDNTLDESEMRIMIEDILEIALVIIPTYAYNITEDEERKVELGKYIKKLNSVLDTMIKYYEILFSQGQGTVITFNDFVDMFNSDEINALGSSSRIRKLSNREHARVIAPATLVKDFILEAGKKN